MAQMLTDVSITSYLDKQTDLPHYHVRPRSELIMLTASHLARERHDSLNTLYLAWAMMRVNGSIAKDLLLACGLTEEKFKEACATPSLQPFNLDSFFDRVVEVAHMRESDLIGTEHVLAAALTDNLLQARLTDWGIDVNALQHQANTLTRG